MAAIWGTRAANRKPATLGLRCLRPMRRVCCPGRHLRCSSACSRIQFGCPMKDARAILRELEEPGDLSIPVLNDAGALDAAHRAELVAGAVRLLSHSSPAVRGKAVWLLATVEAGPEHTPALAASLRDSDRSVRFG